MQHDLYNLLSLIVRKYYLPTPKVCRLTLGPLHAINLRKSGSNLYLGQFGQDGAHCFLLGQYQVGPHHFDRAGKELAKSAPLILSTQAAAKAVPGVTGLRVWDSYMVENEKVPGLKITATPCQHRPWWLPEFFSGPVIGFVLEFPGQSNGVLYISGDTVYFKGIPEIAQRFPKIDIGIFHLGSAQFRYLSGLGRYTMDGKDLEKAVAVLKPNKVLPIHYRGWSHFKESEELLRKQLKNKGLLEGKVQFLVSGERTRL